MQAQLYDFTRELHSLNKATRDVGRSFFRLAKLSMRVGFNLLTDLGAILFKEPELYMREDLERTKQAVEMKKNNYVGTHPPSMYHY
ncbi:hypothetical protein [Bacteriovorax sp. DB6_IX]|uniref:hypothetical protein n=1 Tax=Bacteriovorax sp. DB6_IX TaxID=1353530 RepID=UPI00054DCFD0|nr:hypothetical protein [Bacteriovorax sp. DB6_IX]